MEAVSGRMKKIGNLLGMQFKINTSIANNEEIAGNYRLMAALFCKFSQANEEMHCLLSNTFNDKIRYLSNESTVLKELMEQVGASKLEYLKLNSKLQSRKSSLFEGQNISKWELSSVPEGANLKELLGNKEKAFSVMIPKVLR